MIDPPRLGKESPLGLLLEDARSDRLDADSRARAWRSIEAAAATSVVSAAVVKSGMMSKLVAFAASKVGIATMMCAAALVGGGALFLSTRTPTPPPSIAAPIVTPVETTNVVAAPTTARPVVIETPPVETATMPTPTTHATQRAPQPTSSSAPLPTLAEGRLLLDAKAAIASNPTHALELTTTHQTSFPTSPLAAERESIAIDALAHLGRCGEAHARATQFRATFPTSPHLALVERAEASCK
jgi:hypothetical protein